MPGKMVPGVGFGEAAEVADRDPVEFAEEQGAGVAQRGLDHPVDEVRARLGFDGALSDPPRGADDLSPR